ncbi:MAG: hypothetical protein AB7O59_07685 [Pirellulales bacterium]
MIHRRLSNVVCWSPRRRPIGLACGVGLLLVLVSLNGCAPQLDPATYGKVIYEVPKVQGAEKPYPLPELEGAGPARPEPPK